MKLKFKDQKFQTDAVAAVADLFTGQNKDSATFSILQGAQQRAFGEYGVGNNVLIEPAAMLKNMHTVQRRNKLPLTDDLQSNQFCIEMETGTGKTFVYTKTIFELNERYGFTKFIIVVPSVAIREGVRTSLDATSDYFAKEYKNVSYRYFIYNSKKISDIREYAVSSDIEIMIINIDAFKREDTIFQNPQDKLNGETVKRYIQDTRPIVIIDEPQSVDNTPKSKEAIADLKPLCVLRYSATHREKINLLYRLSPIDAYQMGLVKQICVSSSTVTGDFNKPYIRLVSVSNDKGFSAKLELDVVGKRGAVERKTITVKKNDDLFLLSGRRDMYDGYVVAGFDARIGAQLIYFSNFEEVRQDAAIGGVDENIIKEAQIHRTIQTHFDKELAFMGQGIKVLSLFFIDEVAKYRTSKEGESGIYADMFERCYNELINQPEYQVLKERFSHPVEDYHNGYFSKDKKGVFQDTKGDTQKDDDTYNLIMAEKEKLLSFESPLRFIFSHSALKEGWDNPNVFQVCTLIEHKSSMTARQKVGRGLRLCVNQNGERIEDKGINVLHVMANESFAEFAANLQSDIERDTGMKFGIVQAGMFVGLGYEETITREQTLTAEQAVQVVEALVESGVIAKDGAVVAPERLADAAIPEPLKVEVAKLANKAAALSIETLADITYLETTIEQKTLTHEESEAVIKELKAQKLLTTDGKPTATMKQEMAAGTLDPGARFSAAAKIAILHELQKSTASIPIGDANKRVAVRLKKQAILSPAFLELWNKIKQKTYYRVNIDNEKLTDTCIEALREVRSVPHVQIHYTTAELDIKDKGVTGEETSTLTRNLDNTYAVLPDILRMVSTKTHLKRSTVAHIIRESGRGHLFLQNPQAFTERVLDIIGRKRRDQALAGISYHKTPGAEYYIQDVFKDEELYAMLDRTVEVKNSVYDRVMFDSRNESEFATILDKDENVELFFKIPSRFKIDTPIGTYTPDWAVCLNYDGSRKLYFVLETKTSIDDQDLRGGENWKIHCGRKHFEELGGGIQYDPVTDWKKFKASL
jgi:type III restriction enzyme